MRGIYLSLGDGLTSDSLNLLDTAAHYVVQDGLSLPPPQSQQGKQERREITLRLCVLGATEAALWRNIQRIEQKLHQARESIARGQGPSVTLSIQNDDQRWVYFDVVDGELQVTKLMPGNWAFAELKLECLPLARGEALTVAPKLITPGAVYYVAQVPGDAPALARLECWDESWAGAVNRMRVARRAAPGLTESGVTFLAKLVPAGSSTTQSDPEAYSGSVVTRQLTSSWQTVATVTVPQSERGQLRDVWCRLRDPSVQLATPSNLRVTPAPNVIVRQFAEVSLSGPLMTVSLNQPALAGSLLVLYVGYWHDSGSPRVVLDPVGWRRRLEQQFNTTSNVYKFRLWDKVAAEGEKEVTLVPDALSLPSGKAVILEIIGSLQFANTYTATGSGTTITTPAVVPQQPHELYVGGYLPVSSSTHNWTALHISDAHLDVYLATSTATVQGSWQVSSSGPWASYLLRYTHLSPSPGSLPQGTATFTVTAVNSYGESAIAPPVSATLIYQGSYVVSWDSVPGATSYRVYYNLGSGWKVVTTSTNQLVLSSDTGTAATLPVTTTTNAFVRLTLSVAEQERAVTNAVATQLGNNAWEWLYLGTLTIPQEAPQLAVQARHLGSAQTIALDSLALLPHAEPQLVAEVPTLDQNVSRVWVVETDRFERGRGKLVGSPQAFTVTGTVITDNLRSQTTPQHFDGRSPESSVGVWLGTTNLVVNGSFETDTTGWSAETGVTIARDTTVARHGVASLKVTTNGSTTFQGTRSGFMPVTAGQPYTVSFWARGSGSIEARVSWFDSNMVYLTDTSTQPTQFALSATWQRIVFRTTAPSNAAYARIRITTGNTAQAITFWIDAVQFEQSPFATPYVHTDGATASRSAPQLYLPANAVREIFSPQQGWFAIRARQWLNHSQIPDGYTMGLMFWGPSSGPQMVLRLWLGPTDQNLSLFANPSAGAVERSTAGQVSGGQSFLAIAAWTPTALKLSLNGSTFATASRPSIPDLSMESLCIGSQWGVNHLNGEILWVAMGAGTLTDADAAALAALGDSDPLPSDFPAGAQLTLLWSAVDTTALQPSDAGLLSVRGGLLLDPGPNAVTFLLDESGGDTPSMRALRVQPKLVVTPRYRHVRGD